MNKFKLLVLSSLLAGNITSQIWEPQDWPVLKQYDQQHLYQIALKFDTTVDALKSLNGLNSNLLSIGQVLKIPSSSSSEIVYTVVAGDNLYQIARRFGTTVAALMERNNLGSSFLQVGQKLIIP